MILSDNLRMAPEDAMEGLKLAISILSRSVLDEPFIISGTTVNTCLVISSLEVSGTGKTDSGRAITVLQIPERLDAVEIVRHWWMSHLPQLHPTDLFRLKLIAETMNTQPRVVSFASEFIQQRLVEILKISKTEAPFVTASFITNLYKFVTEKIKSRYSQDSDVSMEKLASLVFNNETHLDDAATKLIRKSFFTNCVAVAEKNIIFIPTGSILMLAAVSRMSQSRGNTPSLSGPFDCFYMLLNQTVDAIDCHEAEKGTTLGVLTEWWLKCRISVYAATGAKSLQLGKLLPMISARSVADLEIPLEMNLNYYITVDSVHYKWPILSAENLTEFAKAFNHVNKLTNNRPFVMYQSEKNQGFDQMLSFLVADPKQGSTVSKAFLVFLDEKSMAVKDDRNVTHKEIDCEHFEQILLLASELARLHKEEGLILSKESEALVRGDFKFIYLTAYDNVYLSSTHPNVVACDANYAANFFGMLWPFVSASRSPST